MKTLKYKFKPTRLEGTERADVVKMVKSKLTRVFLLEKIISDEGACSIIIKIEL